MHRRIPPDYFRAHWASDGHRGGNRGYPTCVPADIFFEKSRRFSPTIKIERGRPALARYSLQLEDGEGEVVSASSGMLKYVSF
jgi:hypothetical protein